MADENVPSFNAQLRALAKGETLSRTKRFEIGAPDAGDVNDHLQMVRRNVNAAVSRIREATGSNFRVESAAAVTNDNAAILAVVGVTRL